MILNRRIGAAGKYLVIIATLIAGTSVLAQDELPSWCPLEETNPAATADTPKIVLDHGQLTYTPDSGEPIVLDGSGNVVAYTISDDGRRVAVVRRDNDYRSELRVAGLDTSGGRMLLGADAIARLRDDATHQLVGGIGQLEWAGGDSLIFTSSLTNTGDGIYIFVADDLWKVNVDSGELTNLLAQGQGGEFLIAPDGQQIAVMSPDRLSLVSTDGSSLRGGVLDSYRAIGFGEYYVFPPLHWQPDSSGLLAAVSSSADPYSQDQGAVTVWRIPTDGSAPAEIATFDAFYPSLSFSPDVQFVAYWRSDGPLSNTREIVIARTDGSERFTFLKGPLIDFNGWTDEQGRFEFTDAGNVRSLGDICGGKEALPITGLDVTMPAVS